MITIPKRVEYSIVMLTYLSKNGDKMVSLSEISEKLNLPYRFLGQLAIKLKKAGIVESKEGKTGGYVLAKDWQKKSLYDLIESLNENKHMVKCLGTGVCSREKGCQLKNVWGKLEKGFRGELQKIKLNEI